MNSSENNSTKYDTFEFNNYKSLVSAEIDLIQRVLEIRQNFSNPSEL